MDVNTLCKILTVSEKCSNNSYNVKEYSMPSGDISFVQGYEPFALDIILKTYK